MCQPEYVHFCILQQVTRSVREEKCQSLGLALADASGFVPSGSGQRETGGFFDK